MSSRGADVIVPDITAPPLPPDEEIPATCADHLRIVKGRHMKALIWKNFLWMWRNVG